MSIDSLTLVIGSEYGLTAILALIISILATIVIFLLATTIVNRIIAFPKYTLRQFALVRDVDGYPSLARFQFLVFVFTILFSYVWIFNINLLSGNLVTSAITSNVLVWLGISAGSLFVSGIISQTKYKDRVYRISYFEYTPPLSTMLLQGSIPSIGRYQMFWVVIAVTIYYLILVTLSVIIGGVNSAIHLPEMGAAILIIISVSQILFLLSKIVWRAPQYTIDTITTKKGIDTSEIETSPSTETSKKIEIEFSKVMEGLHIHKLLESRAPENFVNWCATKVGEDPKWFLSKISNDLIRDILHNAKSYYATLFVNEINTKLWEYVIEDLEQNKVLRVYDLKFSIKPIHFYVEFARLVVPTNDNENQVHKEITSRVKITFRIDTDLNIEDITVSSTNTGLKSDIGILVGVIKLSVSKVLISKPSVNYLYRPKRILELDKGDFKVHNIFVYEATRNVKLWIFDLNREVDLKATEPLIRSTCYRLVISVSGTRLKSVISDSYESKIQAVLLGEGFEFSPSSEHFLLKRNMDSKIEFVIKPKLEGNHKLMIVFYYKTSILQTLVTSIKVLETGTEILQYKSREPSIEIENQEKYRTLELIETSDIGFDSLRELESTKNAG